MVEPNLMSMTGFVSMKEVRDIRLVPGKNSGRRLEIELLNKTLVLLAESAVGVALALET